MKPSSKLTVVLTPNDDGTSTFNMTLENSGKGETQTLKTTRTFPTLLALRMLEQAFAMFS